jgi:hypothetical protein
MTSTPRSWPSMPALAACLLLAACGGEGEESAARTALPLSAKSPQAIAQSFRTAGLVYGTPVVALAADGQQKISAPILTQSGAKTISVTVATADVAAVTASLVPGNLVDWLPGADADSALAAAAAGSTFNVILRKGNSTAAQFDAAKFGPEVGPNNGIPGPMVAAGWVYKKAGTTITVGDGRIVTADMAGRPYDEPIKRYEEKYVVAREATVFEVNTSNYAASRVSDFDSIPVTADYHYATTSRQAAYLLFDANHQRAESAKVIAIWYFTPQSTSDGKPVWDVPTLSPLLADKGNDPVSGQPYVAINATGVTAAPYTRSTEPFEIVKGMFYYVGDNEVAS